MLHVLAAAIVLSLTDVSGAPPTTVARAQVEVVRLFRSIDVDVRWARGAGAPHAESIHVVLAPYERGGLERRLETVLGAAIRTDRGTAIAYVFYRRVEGEARQYGSSEPLVLACAIAHEIAHLLMPGRVHSALGLMRASWNREDFSRAERGQLRFSDEEAAIIRAKAGDGG